MTTCQAIDFDNISIENKYLIKTKICQIADR